MSPSLCTKDTLVRQTPRECLAHAAGPSSHHELLP